MKTTCFIVEYTSLSKPLRERISDWCGFHNDCLLPMRSEFMAEDLCRGMAAVEEYWKDQQEAGLFQGDLAAFIKSYGLEFDVWLIEQKFDLEGVEKILVNVSW